MASLHQLATFLEVAECGSVRGAAERLVVSQPAVSAALASLQREIGGAIVERDGRGIRLTAAGHVLERYARRTLALLDEGIHQTRAAAAARQGALRIAAVTTAAEQILPQLIAGFRKAKGQVDVELEVANRARVWELLGQWRVELVLAGRPPHGVALHTLAQRENELVVVGPAGTRALGADALANWPWLLRELGSGTRQTTEEYFAEIGIDPERLTIGSNGAIRECVRRGLGLSLMAREAATKELGAGTLVAVATPRTPLARPWHLASSNERDLSPTALSFIEYCCSKGGFVRPRTKK